MKSVKKRQQPRRLFRIIERIRSFIPKKSFITVFLIFWLLVLTLLYAILSIVRHTSFQSGGFDLGIYDQAIWKYAHFEGFYNSIKERTILGDHLTLTLPLLAPLYWIFDDASLLLFVQAVFVGVAAFGMYRIALNRELTSYVSCTIAVVFSLFYGIQYALFFDFHPIVLGLAFLVWFIYAFEKKRMKTATVFFILTVLTQENMGLAVSCVGLVYLFDKNRFRQGILLFGTGLVASFIPFLIIRQFSPVGYSYSPQFPDSFASAAGSFVDSLEKQQVWLYTLSSFSVLPFLYPGTVIAVLFDLAQYFLSGENFARMWSPFMHHRILLSVYLALGMMYIFSAIKNKKRLTMVIATLVILSTFFQQWYFHLPLNKLVKKEFWKREQWMNDALTMIDSISPDVSIATQQNFVPHLSHRNDIYIVYPKKVSNEYCKEPCWWLTYSMQPEYLLVDTRSDQWLTQILTTNENYQEAIWNMEKSGIIKDVNQKDSMRLYKMIK